MAREEWIRMKSLEQTLFRFWSSCVTCLRRGAMLSGYPHATEAYLRGFYDGLRDILGHPPGPELEFHYYPELLEDGEPDGVFLAQEHWIATRVFENELVAVWGPMEETPDDFANCPPDRMWLCSQPGAVWGRIYRRPLRPEKPLEKMALESTKHALQQQHPASAVESVPDQSPPVLAGTSYRAFTEVELNSLVGDWAALASAAHRANNHDHLRNAAENTDDPRVWTWYALRIATTRTYGYDDEEANRARWLALAKLRLLDPDNGAADFLEAFLYVRVGLASKCAATLGRSFRRKRLTFYGGDRRDLLLKTSQKFGWTADQRRHLILSSSGELVIPISVFRKEAAHLNARASLKKLAIREMNKPLIIQQMLGCTLLAVLAPKSRAVARFRKRSRENLEFIRALRPEQLTEQRWESYFSDVLNRSENEAIERIREEGYKPMGSPDSWLDRYLLQSDPTRTPSDHEG